jgi:hypothetical protein
MSYLMLGVTKRPAAYVIVTGIIGLLAYLYTR